MENMIDKNLSEVNQTDINEILEKAHQKADKGHYFYGTCEYKKAINYFKEAVDDFYSVHDLKQVANCETNIFVCNAILKNFEEAIKHGDIALKIFDDFNMNVDYFNQVANFCHLYSSSGKKEKAYSLLKESIQKYQDRVEPTVLYLKKINLVAYKRCIQSEDDCIIETLSLIEKFESENDIEKLQDKQKKNLYHAICAGYEFIKKTYEKRRDFDNTLKYSDLYTKFSISYRLSQLSEQLNCHKDLVTSEKIKSENIENNQDKSKEIVRLKFKVNQLENEVSKFKNYKQQFIENINHEIKTPLNVIIGFTDLLTKESIKNEIFKEQVQYIKTASEHLESLVDSLLNDANTGSERIKVNKRTIKLSSIFDYISKAYLHIAEEKGIKFYINHSDNLPTYITSDRELLIKSLMIICENAINYTDNGHVTLTAKYSENKLIITIEDTGKGISREDLPNIFGKFIQGKNSNSYKNKGFGLGLYVAKQSIHALNGSIDVKSTLNEGSIFTIILPTNNRLTSTNTIDINKNLQHLKVLIVDDNKLNLKLLQGMLSRYKIQTYITLNGKESLEVLKENNEIDIVLMDIQMPVMDGYEAVEIIKSSERDIPVIAQTALTMNNDKLACLNAGFDDYLPKPIKLSDLIKKIIFHTQRDKN